MEPATQGIKRHGDSQEKPPEERQHDVVKLEESKPYTSPSLPPKPIVPAKPPVCKPRPPPRSPKPIKKLPDKSNDLKKHDQITISGLKVVTNAPPSDPASTQSSDGIPPQLHSDQPPHKSPLTGTPSSSPKQTRRHKDGASSSDDDYIEMEEMATHPGLPKKPVKRAAPNALQADEKALKFCEVGDRMKLKDFSRLKSVQLPCLLKITQGYTSLSERYTVSADQFFVAIEVKTADAVKIRDVRTADVMYHIPLLSNSFAVVPGFSEAVWQQFLDVDSISIDELLGCHTLPRMLQVACDVTSDKGRQICTGAVIFPQEIKGMHKAVQKRALVAKLHNGAVFHIPSSSSSMFRKLNRIDTTLSLEQAVKVLKSPFEAVLKAENDDIYSNHIRVEGVETGTFVSGIMKCQEEISLENISSSFRQPCQIPISISIAVVRIVPQMEKVLDDIYESAQSYYNLRESTKMTTRKQFETSPSAKTTQSQDHDYVMMTSRRPSDSDSVLANKKPIQPCNVDREHYPSLSPVTKRKSLLSSDQIEKIQKRALPGIPPNSASRSPMPVPRTNSQVYDSISHPPPSTPPGTPPTVRSVTQQSPNLWRSEQVLNRPLPIVPVKPRDRTAVRTQSQGSTAPVASLSSDAATTYCSADEVNGQVKSLQCVNIARSTQPAGIPTHTRNIPSPARVPTPTSPTAPQLQSGMPMQTTVAPEPDRTAEELVEYESTMEMNVDVLKTVDEVKVLQMLDMMNLSAYKESFQREFVNGELLSEMDDEMLKELGVQKAIHRKRLMRVIQGKDSIDKFAKVNPS